MQVVTISGFKGGTGKTTVASLLGVAAVKNGLRVAALDLDRNTRNLANFLTVRRAAKLPCPDHVMLMDLSDGAKSKSKHSRRLEPLVRMARLDGYDLLVIDTSSGNLVDVYEAHLLADVLFAPVGSKAAPKINYREMIETVRFDRQRAGLPVQRWHVIMNRVSSLHTKVGDIVNNRIEQIAIEAGFERMWRLRDRVAHRALSLEGRSVFDEPVEGHLTMSELAGRSEVRALLSVLDPAPLTLTRLAA
jgi:cellulose biosynthesis protein BcsQ